MGICQASQNMGTALLTQLLEHVCQVKIVGFKQQVREATPQNPVIINKKNLRKRRS